MKNFIKAKHRVLSALIAICMVLGLMALMALPATAAGEITYLGATIWTDPNNLGTSPGDYSVSADGDTYTIKTAKGLAWVADQANNGSNSFLGKTIILESDINLDGHNWIPIGENPIDSFQGIFDGNGKTISNMTVAIKSNETVYAGLFGFAADATIKNLNLAGSVTIEAAGSSYAGGVLGAIEKSNIISCSFDGDIAGKSTNGRSSTGGIVGEATTSSLINNCYQMGAVTAEATDSNETAYAGGVAGSIINQAPQVHNSYHVGIVTATGSNKYVGGIVGGSFEGGVISNSYYDSTVDAAVGMAVGNQADTLDIIGKSTAELKTLTDTLNGIQIYTEGDYVWAAATEDSDNGGYPKLIPAPITTYIDENGIEQEVVANKIISADTSLGKRGEETWYVVNEQVLITDRITITHDVNLILANNVSLVASKGIEVNNTNGQLTIYAQKTSNDETIGALNAWGSDSQPGIGTKSGIATINIYGGNIVAQGDGDAAAIGSMPIITIADTMKYGSSANSVSAVEYTKNATGAAITNFPQDRFIKITEGNLDWQDLAKTALVNTDYTITGNDYTVLTAKGLAWVAEQVNSGKDNFTDKTITLAADIDLTTAGIEGYGEAIMAANASAVQKALSWQAIGWYNYTSAGDYGFNGIFDGNGHTISGLYINMPDQRDQGLFGYIKIGATVQNIGIINSQIIGAEYVGSVAGDNYGQIFNCYNTGDVYSQGNYVGGIAGSSSYGIVANCYNTGIVSGAEYIGGVIGDNRIIVQNSYNLGDIIGTGNNVGGVVGANFNNGSTATNCYYDDSISITATNGIANNIGQAKPLAEMTTQDFVSTLNGDPSSNAWFFKTPSSSTSYYPGLVAFENVAGYTPPSYTVAITGGGGGDKGSSISEPELKEPETSAGQTNVEIEIKPTTSGGISSADIPDDTLEEAVTKALEAVESTDNAPKVTINIDTPSNANGLEISLSSALLEDLAADENAVFEIKSDAGTMTFDRRALSAIIEAADGKDVSLVIRKIDNAAELTDEQRAIVGDAPTYELYIESDGKRISDFEGGSVTVQLPEDLDITDNSVVTVYYIADDGSIEPVLTYYNSSDNTVIFVINHLSHYVIRISEQLAFVDVAAEAWYYEDIAFAYANGLMQGMSATTFEPNSTVTRAMMAQVIWNMEGKPAIAASNPFSDIADSDWYYEAIAWTAENGIYKGISETIFAPNDPVTREQLAAILYRYAEHKGYNLAPKGDLSQFTDGEQVSDWAAEAIQWAIGSELMLGKGEGILDPQGTATRAEIAAILGRFIGL